MFLVIGSGVIPASQAKMSTLAPPGDACRSTVAGLLLTGLVGGRAGVRALLTQLCDGG
jgi:hypothetical protein